MTTEAKEMIDRFLENPGPASEAYDLLYKVRDILDDDDECYHGALDPDGMCIGCGSTADERRVLDTNTDANKTPNVDRSIEVLAVEFLERVQMAIDSSHSGADLHDRIAAIIRDGRTVADVIQTFAGFLTEHTMQIEVAPGERRAEVPGVKLQDSRGSLVERNPIPTVNGDPSN